MRFFTRGLLPDKRQAFTDQYKLTNTTNSSTATRAASTSVGSGTKASKNPITLPRSSRPEIARNLEAALGQLSEIASDLGAKKNNLKKDVTL